MAVEFYDRTAAFSPIHLANWNADRIKIPRSRIRRLSIVEFVRGRERETSRAYLAVLVHVVVGELDLLEGDHLLRELIPGER